MDFCKIAVLSRHRLNFRIKYLKNSNMKKWQKSETLTYFQSLVDAIPEIINSGRGSSEHIRWVSNVLKFLEDIFGEQSLYYKKMSHLSWSETGTMLLDARNYESEAAAKHNSAFIKQMEQAKGFLQSAKDQLEINEIDDLYTSPSPITNDFITILKLGETKLRKLLRKEPESEREVQEKYEDLLIGAGINYSREYLHIDYSSKQYIPDFSFTEFDLVVELKLCRGDEKKLIAQLNDDILAYKTKFNNIIFIIYDLGNIRDADSFKDSFEKSENVFVQIIKH